MEGFMTDSRNIIIVKKEKKMSKKDQYAAPQNVFHISGNTGGYLSDFRKNSPEIIKIIRQTEIEVKELIKKALLDPKLPIHFRSPWTFHLIINIWCRSPILFG
jgi:hypothetical protein